MDIIQAFMQYTYQIINTATKCDESYTPIRYRNECYGAYKFVCSLINKPQETQLREWFSQIMIQFESIINEKENLS